MNALLKQTGISIDAEIFQLLLDGETFLFEILSKRYNPVFYKIASGYSSSYYKLNHGHFKYEVPKSELISKSVIPSFFSTAVVNRIFERIHQTTTD